MAKVKPSVYVVDDDVSVREAVGSLIRSAGLRVETFASAQDFLARGPTDVPSCLVLDVRLPGLSGFDLQRELARANIQIPIIFLTGHGDIPMSVRAIKAGAQEFFTKPFDDAQLLDAIQQGLSLDARARQPRRATAQSGFEGIIGTSAALRAVLKQVEAVAATESTVLILGETGTGKEMIARAIHKHSQRSGQTFVSVNCAAIPASLIASELFGHERGAFTGAEQRRLGRFELADGGTIFLDEIGDLPAETQLALLRVLQEREFERVGGNHSIPVNVRVIAATNRDLYTAVADGSFRSDLFYRLNVFPIVTPPLRERKEDIPLLTEHFIHHDASKLGKKVHCASARTMDLLRAYRWPGNIRELQNLIERAVIVCDTEELSVDESWLFSSTLPEGSLLSATLANQEREMVESALAEAGGKVSGPSGAAVKLGIPPSTLESRIRSLNIDKHRFKPQSLPQ